MPDDNKTFVKHCAHCGVRTEGHIYCPKCGDLVITRKYGEDTTPKSNVKSNSLERICSGCNSVITSIVLEQCPICSTLLEKIPEHIKQSQEIPGLIFSKAVRRRKSGGRVYYEKEPTLHPEQESLMKKDSWDVKEGKKVFTSCILTYVIIQLCVIMFFYTYIAESSSSSVEITIFLVLLGQIAGIMFGIYPLWYIYSNKHNFKKLGFSVRGFENLIAVFIGILGAILLIGINYLLSPSLMAFFSGFGFDLFNISNYLEEENNILREADLIWIIVLMGMVCLQAVSAEIVFRGVLQNTLKVKYVKSKNDTKGKMRVICLVALIYACIYILFSFMYGIVFFLLNFAVFLVLGILYEINENIWNTIIASAVYHNLLIILILLSF